VIPSNKFILRKTRTIPMTPSQFITVASPVDRAAKRLPDPMLSNRAFAIFFIVTILIALTLLLAPKAGAQGGTSATWNGSQNNNWIPSQTGGNQNWSTGNHMYPGTVDTTTNANTATFNISGGNPTITLNPSLVSGTTLNIKSITFDLAAVGAYTIGTTGGPTLRLTNGGTIQMTATAISSNETVNAPLEIQSQDSSYTFLNNSTSTGTLTIGGPVTWSSALTSGHTGTLFLDGSNSGNNTVSGAIGNGAAGSSGSVTKNGTGTWILSGANTYSGTTTLSAGTLILNGTNSSAGATTTSGNSTLQLGAGTNGGLASGLLTLGNSTIESTDSTARTISNAVKFTANVTFGAAAVNTGAMTFNGTVDLNGGTRTLTTVSNTTFANAISGSGVGITKLGAATLTFSGSAANTYDGVTTVNVGELDLNKTAVNAIAGDLTIGDGTSTDTVKLLASNQIANTSVVTLTNAGSAVFNLNNQSEVIGSLTDSTTGASGSAVQLGTGTLTFGDSSNRTYGGVISGTGGNIVKQGSGTQTLTGANTYTGTTTISTNGGTLNAGATNALGGTSGITVNSGGTLLLSNSGTTNRINNSATINLGSGATVGTGGIFNTGGLNEGPVGGASGSLAAMGALTLNSNSTIDFTSANSSNLLFSSLTYTAGTPVRIEHWTGAFFTDNGAATNDRLLFISSTGLTTAQLASIQFTNDAGALLGTGATQIPFNGYFELVPVPEPSTWIGGALALAAIGFSQRRRFVRKTAIASVA
jgi:fibronectin-binding autotransporter adhesin